MNSFYIVTSNDDIQHHGIKGQRWGIRRFQNKDGSLTSAGERRYGGTAKDEAKRNLRSARKEYIKKSLKYNNAITKASSYWTKKGQSKFSKATDEYEQAKTNLKDKKDAYKKTKNENGKSDNKKTLKKVAIATGVVAAAGAISYAVYKNRSSTKRAKSIGISFTKNFSSTPVNKFMTKRTNAVKRFDDAFDNLNRTANKFKKSGDMTVDDAIKYFYDVYDMENKK